MNGNLSAGSLVVFILLIPLTFLILRVSKPIPEGEVPATYGIPQKPVKETEEQAHEEKPPSDEQEQSPVETTATDGDKQPEAEEKIEKL